MASPALNAYLAEFAEPTGYLDFARFGPPSRAVADITDHLTRLTTRSGPTTVNDLMGYEGRAKRAVARLCRTTPEHVVLLPNTSLGLLQAAFGVHGRVLVPKTDFPANTYPWARAEQAGRITVDWLTQPASPDTIRQALTPETTTVTVSAIDFRTGYRMDLAALRDIVKDRLLVVNGIQGFGAVEADWQAADVLVVGGQKWLRAGWGTGFAVLSDAAMDRTSTVLSSWTGAKDPMLFDNEIHDLADDAARWNISNLSPITSAALATALELAETTGIPAIEARIAERVGELRDAVLGAGARVVSEGPTMLTFGAPDIGRTAAVLKRSGIAASTRTDHIRLSPHASTSSATVEAVGAAMAQPGARAAGR